MIRFVAKRRTSNEKKEEPKESNRIKIRMVIPIDHNKNTYTLGKNINSKYRRKNIIKKIYLKANEE